MGRRIVVPEGITPEFVGAFNAPLPLVATLPDQQAARIAKAERGVVLAARRWAKARNLFNHPSKASPKQRKAGLWETFGAAAENLARAVERVALAVPVEFAKWMGEMQRTREEPAPCCPVALETLGLSHGDACPAGNVTE